MDARTAYVEGKGARAREADALERRARTIGLLRLLVALGALALVGAIVWARLPPLAWAAVGALAVGFVGLVIVHARVHDAKDRALAAQRFHERGLDRLDGRWHAFASNGERFLREPHLFADDLDLFGRGSLFQLIDTTETRFGADRLAALLGDEGDVAWEGVRERQAAVKDLAPRLPFRERLSAAGALLGTPKPDPTPFLAWAEASRSGALDRPMVRVFAWALPALTLGSFIFAPMMERPRAIALVPLALSFAVLAWLRSELAEITQAASSREQGLARYGEMLAAISEEALAAPLVSELRGRAAEATREMARLGTILSFLDARENEVFRIFIAPILLWDVHCARALQAWRVRAGQHVRAWLAALAEVEALASLAAFAFDRPDHAFPDLEQEPTFRAKGLAHPLIASGKRVPNDVTIAGPGQALIVTGSNMSGKSTLLRAIGVACVLARAGGPVCAEALTLGRFRVATSMRVRDSIEEGVSRFYAELKKLKAVLDSARAAPTLFLLDEILHGTNSRERLIGARAIVKTLLGLGALGAASTHDLALGDLGAAGAANVHFEEQVAGDAMTFDYKLREGIVQSSNALRLMRLVGLDVV